MRDAARATSAVPTYFEPISFKAYGDNTYFSFIDGGVFANNPSMCAYVEAKNMYKRDDILVVSLGVGEHTRPIYYKNAKNWGLAMWAKPVLGVVFDGVSSTVDYQLKELLPKINGINRYYRFQSRLDIGSDEMDDTSKSNINALITNSLSLYMKTLNPKIFEAMDLYLVSQSFYDQFFH
ncbi:MAG TPA: patatin-like phospholipase family protein [Ruminiclostridium sp.]